MSNNIEYLPIRTVAALTGVKAITLRAWERRYGLIRPVRTPKGQRLYTRRDVELINKVLTLVERGVAIGQMRAALAAEQEPPSAIDLETGTWQVNRRRMELAIARFDEQDLDSAYDAAVSVHSIQRVSELLLVPLLTSLGDRWTKVKGAIAEEHFFAVYLRNKLGARLHHRHLLSDGPKLLTACAPDEYHEVGLLLFALAAHEARMRVVCLGANTPFEEIAIAARRASCHAVVLSSSFAPAPEQLQRELHALVMKVQMPVFFGGTASTLNRDSITAAGAIVLGRDLDFGVQMIRSTLTTSGKTA
jgi:MerR family transcriptional regulator, light-induced transcriptional regulator